MGLRHRLVAVADTDLRALGELDEVASPDPPEGNGAVGVAAGAGLGECNDLRDPCSTVPAVEHGAEDAVVGSAVDGDGGADRAAERLKSSRLSSGTSSALGRDDGAANSRRDFLRKSQRR